MTSYEPLEQTATLELQGARDRLDHAIRMHRAFTQQNGEVHQGTFMFRANISAESRTSLEREYRTLLTQLDDANRLVQHCANNFSHSRA